MTAKILRLAIALSISGPMIFAAETAAAGAPTPFKNGKFDEVVNEVAVFSPSGEKRREAQKNDPFTENELVKTARKSRSEIVMDDGTIIRIGANAVFTFGKDARSLNLERGSVLFHTPPGKGGGTIVTNFATASVTGTTITVSIDANGNYECCVLEGSCTVQAPGHTPVTLKAGDIVHLEGLTGTQAGTLRTGKFDLSEFIKNSPLIAGFISPLPSLQKINEASTAQQASGGATGTFTPTAQGDTQDTSQKTSDTPAQGSTKQTFRLDINQGILLLSPNGEGSLAN